MTYAHRNPVRNASRRLRGRFSVESLERRLLACAEHEASPLLGTFPHLPNLPEAAGAIAALDAALPGGTQPLSSIPVLDSLPSAAAALYLDFNGHFDAVWGSDRNVSTPVFDRNGDATTFSGSELNAIQQIWRQVAEDFAPFNINVTTVEPASFANRQAMRAAIGGDGAWAGGSYGGVAYVDSFTNSLTNTVYVFPKNLANGNPRYVAEAVAHEAGHGFGLAHQSLFSAAGAKLDEYSPGSGDGRAPIMGDSYQATRGLWWKGPDSDNHVQDDLAVIGRAANGFGFRADDHGNGLDQATPLIVSGTGDGVTGVGVIHAIGDVDYFSFTSGAGQISVSVAVPAGINNLDARLELRNSAGELVSSAAPSTAFGATINTTLVAGDYVAVVASQGSYGDVGQYTVSGTIVPFAVQSDSIPPAITEITVRSSTWSPDILAAMEAAGLGLGGVTVSPSGTTILPWATGIDQIIVQFDSEVNPSATDLAVSGLNSANYEVATVAYDPETTTVTWTLVQAITADTVTLDLAQVRDPAGNAVLSPAAFAFVLLPGDVDQNGQVDIQDFQANRVRQFSPLGSPAYSVLHDLDTNGAINIHDWQIVLQHVQAGSSQTGDPSPAAVQPALLQVGHVSRDKPGETSRNDALPTTRSSITSSRRVRAIDTFFATSDRTTFAV
jgi:hypothetical protein